nr:MAG TPA: hypothetical protein [Caudoviricetes sp.]
MHSERNGVHPSGEYLDRRPEGRRQNADCGAPRSIPD